MSNEARIIPVGIQVVCEECCTENIETGDKVLCFMIAVGPLIAARDNTVQTQAYICPVCENNVTVVMTVIKPS